MLAILSRPQSVHHFCAESLWEMYHANHNKDNINNDGDNDNHYEDENNSIPGDQLIETCSFTKMFLKILSAKCLPCCSDLNIESLVQDCSISSMLAMEILRSCTKPSIWYPSGAETEIFWENQINTADALGTYVSRSSAATMILIIQDKQVLIFHKERFQIIGSSQCWEVLENVNISLLSGNKFSKLSVKSMAQCKTAVSPLLTHWRYCSLALSHQNVLLWPPSLCGLPGSPPYYSMVT